jgi:hypothetical protein
VSPEFVQVSAAQLNKFREKKSQGLELMGALIDRIQLGK